jgi:plasmid stabilization system protein ParE
MKTIISAPARNDLRKITLWIADENPFRAKSFSRELKDAAESIALFPESHAVVGTQDGFVVRRNLWKLLDFLLNIRRCD